MTLVLHGPSYNPALPLIIPEQLAADINQELQTYWMPLSGGPGIGTVVPPGGSIQAALDALPATGGVVTLSANTTYLLTGTLTISKPNTRLQAPSWATIIRRTPGMLGHLISTEATATGFVIRDITIDGNGPLSTSGNFEIAVNGAESLVYHCQIINAGAQGHLALGGADSRADSNTIRGLGTASGGGYGIWAIGSSKVFITNNHITGTAIDAIGFDGNGTQIIGNHIENCQCYASDSTIGGGQIAQYTNYDKVNGAIIANNYIGMGGGEASCGLELYCSDLTVTGNVIANQKAQGVGISVIAGHEHGGLLFTGNTVMNSGQRGASGAPWVFSGVSIFGPQNNIIMTGNRFIDTQATPTQQWGIWCYEAQTFNNVLITNNDFTGNRDGAIHFASPGTNQIINNNIGVTTSFYKTSPVGLDPGSVWNNGGILCVV